MELKERVIVVTGAGQGLGKQFALDCASEGAKLALADLNLETVEKVASECRDAGGEARPYQMDVCSEEQVVAFLRAGGQRFWKSGCHHQQRRYSARWFAGEGKRRGGANIFFEEMASGDRYQPDRCIPLRTGSRC